MEYNCNDYFQYLIRGSAVLTRFEKDVEAFRENRRQQMRRCNHEFILLKEGCWHNGMGFNSSDYVYEHNTIECVHCGLTNKYKKIEDTLMEMNESESIFSLKKIKPAVESEEFNLYFTKKDKVRTPFGIGYSDKFDVKLISKKIINSTHAPLLYHIARTIDINADNDRLIEIMLKLIELENDKEKMNLNTLEDAKSLISRYYDFINQKTDGKKLVKKKD